MDSPTFPISATPAAHTAGVHRSFLFEALHGSRRELAFWSLNAGYWLLFGAIGWLMTRAFRSGMPDVHVTVLLRVASGFVLTSGLRVVFLQARFRKQGWWVKCVVALGCFATLALLEMALFQSLVRGGTPLPGGMETGGPRLMLVRMFTLGLWSAFYFAFHLLEDQHALELRAVSAELNAREHELRHLQARMSPHSIFNALHGVLACREDPEAVRDVTQSLIDHLHFLLRDTQATEPLGRELEALEKYLTIQASRLKGNLICRIYSDAEASHVPVPPMILQPLLEHAFHHRPAAVPLHLWLTARVEHNCLTLTLSHTGDGLPESGGRGFDAIGAMEKRLKLTHGGRASVEQDDDDGWIRTTVRIRLEPRGGSSLRLDAGPGPAECSARDERPHTPVFQPDA